MQSKTVVAICAVICMTAVCINAMRTPTREVLQGMTQDIDYYNDRYARLYGDSLRSARQRTVSARGEQHAADAQGPIPQKVGDPLPLWTTPAFQHGRSQFIISAPGNTQSTLTGYVSPNVLIVLPAQQVWYINDPITGQLTNASGSWSWFVTEASYPNFQCFVDHSATYASQVLVHATSSKRDLNATITVCLREGHRGECTEQAIIPAYTYDGFTRDFEAGYDSWLSFAEEADVNTLRPLQFFFSQGAGGTRGPCTSPPVPCTTTNDVTSGEYVYHGPGTHSFPIEAVTPGDYALPPECLDPAKNLDYQSNNCFS